MNSRQTWVPVTRIKTSSFSLFPLIIQLIIQHEIDSSENANVGFIYFIYFTQFIA